jgi:hypothetical protein
VRARIGGDERVLNAPPKIQAAETAFFCGVELIGSPMIDTLFNASPRRPRFARPAMLLAAVAPVLIGLRPAVAADASPPVILQWFEGTYKSMESRVADVFAAGYGMVYTPPPGRAESGNHSVGYDQFNRFDLGSAGNPTLYGTETGLKAAVAQTHRAGLSYAVDLVLNHNGFSDRATPGFDAAGGYSGFDLNVGPDPSNDGDFNGPFSGGDERGRLAGLIDINHETNYQFIRNPVNPNDTRNIRFGETLVPDARGVRNAADPNNARFYPDQQGPSISVFDPKTGERDIKIYAFNKQNPLAGDAVPENATGYLMRNTQWLVQEVGIDHFRLDAAKHLQGFALDYYDRSVYRQSNRRNLDGSQPNVFSWSEVYTGDKGTLQNYIRKDINPGDPGRVGGNRDTLDFPLFFAMKGNLSNNGFANDWRNVVGSSLDTQDDGNLNGSQGVKFAVSHDDHGPDLSNTAHAYMLMSPGNAQVYFNAHEFGTGRDFPKDGRGDALGGAYGDTITKLVAVRNVYAQGDYRNRYISKESHAIERSKQSLTLLSNRLDNFYDKQKISVDFLPGEHLVELTGNAAKFGAPQVLEVRSDGFQKEYVNAEFLPNNGGDHGYLVYGLQAPQGSLTLGGVSRTLAGGAPVMRSATSSRTPTPTPTPPSDWPTSASSPATPSA